ncbi:hypothetical protein PVK06_001718 [Gossypium arboreum]|uniref:Uncharacterized protein n=1 Tax=Gossypium arboreum TaxID=29729 RepID=A0ABR0R333_GOSAR|nr:hypothetical protein PVK06_001718 [Gossypium arboreum]
MEFGWDMSLKARLRKATTVNSIWLQKEGGVVFWDANLGRKGLGMNSRNRIKRQSWMSINPILGFNLEGFPNREELNNVRFSKGLGRADLEKDLESPIENGDGMKRSQGSKAKRWRTQEWSYVKINFDVAFNKQGNRSCSGTIIRDLNKRVLGSKTVIMDNIPMAFATEALACV